MIDDAERHEVYLARLTTELLNSKIYPSIEAAYKAARAILQDTERIDSIRVLERIRKEVDKSVRKELDEGWSGATESLTVMAVYEAGYAAKLTGKELDVKLSVPGKDKIKSYIDKSIISLTSRQRVNAGTWAEYVNGSVDAAAKQIDGIIVTGYQQGQTVGQMTKAIRDSSNGIIKTQAEALARTGQSHYANQAREAMAIDNLKAIKYRVFVATFDNRTTLTCRGFDGKSWPMADDSYPRLPLHYNERSVYVYTDDPDKVKSGRRAAVGGRDNVDINPNRKLKYRGKRDLDIFKPGQVDAGESMDSWLRSQPDWFIEDSLGETRAKLFKDGGLKIERFTDMTGRPLTLDQLRQLDAKAFERAGL